MFCSVACCNVSFDSINIMVVEWPPFVEKLLPRLTIYLLFSLFTFLVSPSGRASDSGARGRGFDPHSGRRVVSLSKIHLPPQKYL